MVDTSHMMRHVGKVANTDERCVVAFMQLPKRPDHCLIIPVDTLPPRFHDAVMDILKTPEGQQSMPFATALSRHRLPDTGETIFEALHNQGKLRAMPVHNILMLPTPNAPIKLSMILEQQGKLQPNGFQQQDVSNMYETERFNPHTNNQRVNQAENAREIARGLLFEAEMLQAEVKKKQEMAYAKDPSLRPINGVRPAPTPSPYDDPAVVSALQNNNPWAAPLPQAPAFVADVYPVDVPINKPVPLNEPAPSVLEQRMGRLEALLEGFLEKASGTSTAPVEAAPEAVEVAMPASDKLHKRPTPKKLTEETDPSHEA